MSVFSALVSGYIIQETGGCSDSFIVYDATMIGYDVIMFLTQVHNMICNKHLLRSTEQVCVTYHIMSEFIRFGHNLVLLWFGWLLQKTLFYLP